MQGKKENVGTFFRKDIILAEYTRERGKLILSLRQSGEI